MTEDRGGLRYRVVTEGEFSALDDFYRRLEQVDSRFDRLKRNLRTGLGLSTGRNPFGGIERFENQLVNLSRERLSLARQLSREREAEARRSAASARARTQQAARAEGAEQRAIALERQRVGLERDRVRLEREQVNLALAKLAVTQRQARIDAILAQSADAALQRQRNRQRDLLRIQEQRLRVERQRILLERASAGTGGRAGSFGSDVPFRGVAGSLTRIGAAIVFFGTIDRAARGLANIVQLGIQFNAQLEQSDNSIAGIISQVSRLRGVQGDLLAGSERFAAAQGIARDQTQELRSDALDTVATFDELLSAFQVSFAFGNEAGGTPDQIREFTVDISQAASLLGVAQNQLAEEIRSLLRGTITPRNTRIATALGITNEDIRNARAQGELFEFLESRLGELSSAAELNASSFLGLQVRIRDAATQASAAAGEGAFEEIRDLLQDVFSLFVSPQGGISQFSVDAILPIFSAISSVVFDIRSELNGVNLQDFISDSREFGNALEGTLSLALNVALGVASTAGDIVALLERIDGLADTIGIAFGVSGDELVRIVTQATLLSGILVGGGLVAARPIRALIDLVAVIRGISFASLAAGLGTFAGNVRGLIFGPAGLFALAAAAFAAANAGREVDGVFISFFDSLKLRVKELAIALATLRDTALGIPLGAPDALASRLQEEYEKLRNTLRQAAKEGENVQNVLLNAFGQARAGDARVYASRVEAIVMRLREFSQQDADNIDRFSAFLDLVRSGRTPDDAGAGEGLFAEIGRSVDLLKDLQERADQTIRNIRGTLSSDDEVFEAVFDAGVIPSQGVLDNLPDQASIDAYKDRLQQAAEEAVQQVRDFFEREGPGRVTFGLLGPDGLPVQTSNIQDVSELLGLLADIREVQEEIAIASARFNERRAREVVVDFLRQERNILADIAQQRGALAELQSQAISLAPEQRALAQATARLALERESSSLRFQDLSIEADRQVAAGAALSLAGESTDEAERALATTIERLRLEEQISAEVLARLEADRVRADLLANGGGLANFGDQLLENAEGVSNLNQGFRDVADAAFDASVNSFRGVFRALFAEDVGSAVEQVGLTLVSQIGDAAATAIGEQVIGGIIELFGLSAATEASSRLTSATTASTILTLAATEEAALRISSATTAAGILTGAGIAGAASAVPIGPAQGGIVGFASGGPARGPRARRPIPGLDSRDRILAALRPFEYVLPPEAVSYYGLGAMELLRSRAIDPMALAAISGSYSGPITAPDKASAPVSGFANGGLSTSSPAPVPSMPSAGVSRAFIGVEQLERALTGRDDILETLQRKNSVSSN